MNCITLIGMPGCGKSTIGVILAKASGKDFVDTDLLIQDKEGLLLQEIIDGKGTKYFQTVEADILAGLQRENTVIATGGSAIYDAYAMDRLGKLGVIVYIQLPLATIAARISNMKTRGIAMDPEESLESLYGKRVPLYEKYADLVIDAECKDMERIVEEILMRYQSWSKLS